MNRRKKILLALFIVSIASYCFAQTPQKIAVFKVRKAMITVAFEEEPPAEVFVLVEEPPVFPGGDIVLKQFINQNVDYPEQARENEIQGRVYVRFCVTDKGTVDQVSVLRGVHPLLDAAAVAAIKKLPKWTPGKQGGKAVNVWYTESINFQLQQ